MGVINIFLCVILVCHIGTYRCNGVQINIDPPKTIATTVNDIHISCLPDGDEDNGKQLTLIELSRNDQDTIVFVSQCGNVSFGHDSSNKFQAIGHIDKVSSQSYLNVTLVNPESQDTGIYTCIMVYLNTEGHLDTETDSGNLLVENLDVKALEGVLNKMKDRITSLEKENKDLHENNERALDELKDKIASLEKEDSVSQEKVRALEKAYKNQSLEFAALTDKVSYTVMFTAMDKNGSNDPAGDVLAFPDVITRIGTGYNEMTGVFTAPVSGLYAFNAVAMVYNECRFHMYVMVNRTMISKLFAYHDKDFDQSSISSVVKLQTGDRVYCKTHNPCRMYGDQFTTFSGYLIKAL